MGVSFFFFFFLHTECHIEAEQVAYQQSIGQIVGIPSALG